jgi:hypothetical protein
MNRNGDIYWVDAKIIEALKLDGIHRTSETKRTAS